MPGVFVDGTPLEPGGPAVGELQGHSGGELEAQGALEVTAADGGLGAGLGSLGPPSRALELGLEGDRGDPGRSAGEPALEQELGFEELPGLDGGAVARRTRWEARLNIEANRSAGAPGR